MENKEKIITMKLQLKQADLNKIIEYAIITNKLGYKASKEYVLHSDEEHLLHFICNVIYKQFLTGERGNNNE